MKKPTTKSSGNPPGIKRRRRPAINLKRIKAPSPRHDLKLIYTENLDPRTGKICPGFELRLAARAETRMRVKRLLKWAEGDPGKAEVTRASGPRLEAVQLEVITHHLAGGGLVVDNEDMRQHAHV